MEINIIKRPHAGGESLEHISIPTDEEIDAEFKKHEQTLLQSLNEYKFVPLWNKHADEEINIDPKRTNIHTKYLITPEPKVAASISITMDHFFTNVYESNTWGNNYNKEYSGSSGGGSEIEFNKDTYVPFLKKFITDNNIKTVADLGCGDFKCGSLLYNDLDVKYTGYDTYKKIIDYNAKQHPQPKFVFEHLDFYNHKESIKSADLCILKDVLQHWKMDEIYNFLDYLVKSKLFRIILICNCCNQTKDDPENSGRSTPLSSQFYPLKKYNPIKLYNYNTKEVCIISTPS